MQSRAAETGGPPTPPGEAGLHSAPLNPGIARVRAHLRLFQQSASA